MRFPRLVLLFQREKKGLMEKGAQEKFREVLQKFDTAMLTTVDASGRMHARPMAIAEIEDSGDIVFLTDKHSGKVEEIQGRPQVCVTCQNGWKDTLTVTAGVASVFQDDAKAQKIWRKTYQTWFPGGPNDPNLIMIRVRGEQGEY